MTLQRIKLADLTRQYIQQLQEQYAGKDVDVEITIPSESTASTDADEMNEDKFWDIIALLDWSK